MHQQHRHQALQLSKVQGYILGQPGSLTQLTWLPRDRRQAPRPAG